MKNAICLILISLIILFGNCGSQAAIENLPKDSTFDVFKMSDIPSTGTDKASSLTDRGSSLPDDSLTDKASSLTDKPSSLIDEEISLTDKPSSLDDKPSSLTDKPSSLIDEEIPLTDKPSSLDDKPISLTDKPSSLSDEVIPISDKPIIRPNGTNDKESDVIPEEELEKLANLTLSFRQLNGFKQEGDTVSFYFYGLTTTTIEVDFEIYFYIYLYLDGGVRDDALREVKCVAEENVAPTVWFPVQAPFKCSITGLNKQYHTFKFSSSEFISGVPFDNPTLLDPVLTNEAIQKGEILDYSFR